MEKVRFMSNNNCSNHCVSDAIESNENMFSHPFTFSFVPIFYFWDIFFFFFLVFLLYFWFSFCFARIILNSLRILTTSHKQLFENEQNILLTASILHWIVAHNGNFTSNSAIFLKCMKRKKKKKNWLKLHAFTDTSLFKKKKKIQRKCFVGVKSYQ